jgi:hypothetical protein
MCVGSMATVHLVVCVVLSFPTASKLCKYFTSLVLVSLGAGADNFTFVYVRLAGG